MTLVDNAVRSDVQTRALRENDALAVKALIGEQAAYASYYPAMFANVVPGLSVVSPNNSDQAVGAVLSFYDWTFKKQILSHVVTALTEMAQAQQAAMLQQSFAHAASRGVEIVTAHLDIAEDRELAQTIESIAAQNNMTAHVAFNDLGVREPDEITPPNTRDIVKAKKKAKANGDNDGNSIYTFRHPTVEDAIRVWSLVHYINRTEKEKTNGLTGGLDIYDLSNYERLFRDTPETSMVAEFNGEIGAFATGFSMSGPDDNRGLFMWQTGAINGAGKRVEFALLDDIHPDYLNFTVEASNAAANNTAVEKARHLSMEWTNPRAIETEVLGNGHQPEVFYTVAPTHLMDRINRQLTV